VGKTEITYIDVANVVDEDICCLYVSSWSIVPRTSADLEIAMNDVSRVKILHSKRHLVDQRDLLCPLARWSLKIVDDIAIAHCLSEFTT